MLRNIAGAPSRSVCYMWAEILATSDATVETAQDRVTIKCGIGPLSVNV